MESVIALRSRKVKTYAFKPPATFPGFLLLFISSSPTVVTSDILSRTTWEFFLDSSLVSLDKLENNDSWLIAARKDKLGLEMLALWPLAMLEASSGATI